MSDNPIRRAVELARAGNHEEARRIVAQILRQDNDNAEAWLIMAQLIEDPQKAINCWKQVIRLKPDYEKAHQQIARLQEKSAVPAPPAQTTPITESKPATKQCPYCAEIILAEAIKCKYCGSDLRPQQSQPPPRQAASLGPFREAPRPAVSRPAPGQEQIIMTVRRSPWTLSFVLSVIFTFGLYLLWWRRSEIVVTNRRVIARTGLIGKTERSIPLDRVQDVAVSYGLFGRLFNYGNIAIETAGSPRPEVVAHGFEYPEKLKETIMRLSWGEVVEPHLEQQSALAPILVGIASLLACVILACAASYVLLNRSLSSGQVASLTTVPVPQVSNSQSAGQPAATAIGKTAVATIDARTLQAAGLATLHANATNRALTPSATPRPTSTPHPTNTPRPTATATGEILNETKRLGPIWNSIYDETFSVEITLLSLYYTPKSGFMEPKTGNVYLVISLRMKNLGPDTYRQFGMSDFRVLDQNGILHDEELFLDATADCSFDLVDIMPNGVVQGCVAFEVPETGRLELIYAPYQYDNLEPGRYLSFVLR